MTQPFWKMHGAGNDFILIDDRALAFPSTRADHIRHLCDRRRGIGSDGLILLQPPAAPPAHFRMRFYNPDGAEADLCGNGARCVARFAHELGIAPADMLIQTAAGQLRAEWLGHQARIHMPPPRDWQLHQTIPWRGQPQTIHAVNTGVPHAVWFTPDLPALDLPAWGAHLRHHPHFAPAGANANAVQVTGPHALAIRTYERGVEAETLACGTGITAAALIATRLGLVQDPVHVTTAGNDTLQVTLHPLTLTGPAQISFRGTLP